jgi:hypothetical protein
MEKLNYLRISSFQDETNIFLKQNFIDCLIEVSKNDMNKLKEVYSFCSTENSFEDKEKLKYWKVCYSLSKELGQKEVLIDSLVHIISIEPSISMELELIELLKSSSRFEKIQTFYWEKYLKTKNPLDLVLSMKNMVNSFKSKL